MRASLVRHEGLSQTVYSRKLSTTRDTNFLATVATGIIEMPME